MKSERRRRRSVQQLQFKVSSGLGFEFKEDLHWSEIVATFPHYYWTMGSPLESRLLRAGEYSIAYCRQCHSRLIPYEISFKTASATDQFNISLCSLCPSCLLYRPKTHFLLLSPANKEIVLTHWISKKPYKNIKIPISRLPIKFSRNLIKRMTS